MQFAQSMMPFCPGNVGRDFLNRCEGNGHGLWTFNVTLVDGELNGIMRFRRTCVDCGSSEDFNTRGEVDAKPQ